MNLFDVYAMHDITLERGEGCYIYDNKGRKYLDFYGGHAVISIGHAHPHYVQSIEEQLGRLHFFSNFVRISNKEELAHKLGEMSGYDDYQLFLTNSGAEANENAIKFASFHNKRKKIIALKNSFHGRTSLMVETTDIPKYRPIISQNKDITHISVEDLNMLEEVLKKQDVCAVIVEPIQGVGGVKVLSNEFLQSIRTLTHQYGAVFICDEIQCGYGRSGRFFAHQYADIKPDIITIAKGMGNGFPIGGVIIHPDIKPFYGMSGTTYGGNPLACSAALAVLDVLKKENLIENAINLGQECINKLTSIPMLRDVRGKGLIIGVELDSEVKPLLHYMLNIKSIFAGSSIDKNTLRLLPPLTVDRKMVNKVCVCIEKFLSSNQ